MTGRAAQHLWERPMLMDSRSIVIVKSKDFRGGGTFFTLKSCKSRFIHFKGILMDENAITNQFLEQDE